MAEKSEKGPIEVEYVTSMVVAVKNDDGFDHLQFVVNREKESGKYRCFFDVVDVSKVKIQEA